MTKTKYQTKPPLCLYTEILEKQREKALEESKKSSKWKAPKRIINHRTTKGKQILEVLAEQGGWLRLIDILKCLPQLADWNNHYTLFLWLIKQGYIVKRQARDIEENAYMITMAGVEFASVKEERAYDD